VSGSDSNTLIEWLREALSEYAVEPIAIYRAGAKAVFPITALDESDLQAQLRSGDHFIALPKEPAALANIIEVALSDYLIRRMAEIPGAMISRGTERGYPDIEISGEAFGDVHHAVDIKVARRAKSGKQTDSRITLYTGNTYFRYPTHKWSGTFRPFQEYASHLDVIALYTLDSDSHHRINDLQILVHEPWRIASKKRSSTTREYLGAVQSIENLVAGKGEFESEEEFYVYWRKFPFKIGRVVQQQLDKLLAGNVPKASKRKN
jgi:Restriction endonuclease EcoRV